MASPKCYIICSHSNRIVDLLKEYKVDYKAITKRDKPRNCAILEFRFNSKNAVVGITEIYEGNNSSTLSYIQLFPLQDKTSPKDEQETTRIFVIRHGEGIHNTGVGQVKAKVFESFTDPLLTKEEGIQQSKSAGIVFTEYLTNKPKLQILDLFVSNLQRSYYTLYYFLSAQLKIAERLKIRVDNQEPNTHQYSASFIVVPNSEEVSKSLLKGYENKSKCTNDSKDTDSEICSFISVIQGFDVTIDWGVWDSRTTSDQNMFDPILTGNYKSNSNQNMDDLDNSVLDNNDITLEFNGGKRRVKKTRRRRRKYRKHRKTSRRRK